MPQIRSMKKSLRQSLKRRDRNRAWKVKVKSARRGLLDNLGKVPTEDSAAAYIEAQKMLDKAVKRGILHAKTAARRKSDLARRLNATMQS